MNRRHQINGDHEIHVLNATCPLLPETQNRLSLGKHSSCHEALQVAKEHNSRADGCAHCCDECHKS